MCKLYNTKPKFNLIYLLAVTQRIGLIATSSFTLYNDFGLIDKTYLSKVYQSWIESELARSISPWLDSLLFDTIVLSSKCFDSTHPTVQAMANFNFVHSLFSRPTARQLSP